MAIRQELWGPETGKAVENFPVSGEQVPAPVVHWLGRIKAAAARVNAELGLLDADVAELIARAGYEVAGGEHDDQFPIDVFQTGSGTSSNMNANEVIANLAGDWADVVKAGRTHMMDAVPVTLGQEFGGYAAQISLGRDRVEDALRRASEIPLGGTATGTGLNTHPEFAERVREKLGLGEAPRDRFEAQANRDALVELHGALKVVAVSLTKIANDLVLMGSGPRTGLVELQLPELQKGSSIMPGKVNPVIPEVVLQVAAQVIGNDTAVTVGGSQGQFELNVRVPMIARNLLDSIKLLASASRLLDEKCVAGIEANTEMTERHAEATLATATALNPHIGYDRASEIVREAAASGRMLREVAQELGVEESVLEEAPDHRRMARPHD